jgi:hypothetical protein
MRLATARGIDRSVILAATVSLASKQYGFPSDEFWYAIQKDQSYYVVTLILIAGAFGVLTPFETLYRRARAELRVSIRRQILTTLGQILTIRIAASRSAPISDLGLHIWRKKRSLRHPKKCELVRVATYRLGSAPVTLALRPTPGKGVVGLCWQLDREVGVDVEELTKVLDTERKFAEYREQKGRAAVMGFSWEEFQRFRHRGAVFASPIRNGRASFIGCISLDAIDGYRDLSDSRIWHELNSLCLVIGQDGFENV